MDNFPKRFTAWWNKIGSRLPYTEKCVALAAYQYGRASRDLESRPTARAKRPVQQPHDAIASCACGAIIGVDDDHLCQDGIYKCGACMRL